MKKTIWVIVIIIILLLGWLLFHKTTSVDQDSDDYATSTGEVATTTTDTTSNDTVSVTADTSVVIGGAREFTVVGDNFSFSPKSLTVKKGDTVKVTFVNKNGFHDFRLDEFKVATKQIKANEQEIVTFVADKAGSFQYYCSVGEHRAMGMWGTLTVTN